MAIPRSCLLALTLLATLAASQQSNPKKAGLPGTRKPKTISQRATAAGAKQPSVADAANALRKRVQSLPVLPTFGPTTEDPAAVKIPAGSSRLKRGLFSCPCSPSNRTGRLPDRDLANFRRRLADIGGPTVLDDPSPSRLSKLLSQGDEYGKAASDARSVVKKCQGRLRVEGCVNADAKTRGTVEPPLCTYDSVSGRNIKGGVTVGSCANDARFNLTQSQLREGCVAVEHLEGYVLQHPRHLLRPVLCGRGFCATRNHAVVIAGKYTSMARICSADWECTERFALVNNLKVAANRRALVHGVDEHIVVTPYDIRFPKVAVWAVQMLEDVWNMLAVSVCSGTVAGVTVLVLSKTNLGEQ